MAEPATGRPGCLVTRPEPAATDTATRIAALGWDPILAPALTLTPVTLRPAPPSQAVLVASAAAIPSLTALDPPPPVLAVGAATAEAARRAGFPQVTPAEGDAASLADLAARTLDPAAGPLLLAVGETYGLDLAAALRDRGFRVVRRTAYAARPATALPDPARDALATRRVKAALFLSPRSATTCVALLRAAGLESVSEGIRALALSPRIAAAIATLRWAGLDTAPRPRLDDLLTMLGPARADEGGAR
ncbi:uroporphyrinogen-III synthase [Roseomonas sp. CCTCC AB2023176]|uniref:uroporphyrinogen-III synthase n=1 Tax=Roseomonas sp. CCTCC AB2023176 TaxID=3342640 RepID=UPI0035DA590A